MSFLAPLFLLGATAIALPIIFHLIRQTSKEKTVFSSLMFLLPTPPKLTRRSRLENIWLLILRCLVLGLLAAGFARPFLRQAASAQDSKGAARRIAILLDTSASMRRENLWSEAQKRAEAVLKKTSPIDHVAVFTFDRQIIPVVSFEEWSRMEPSDRAPLTARRLAGVSPGWGEGALGTALLRVAQTFDETAKVTHREEIGGPRQIVLISDLQEGSGLHGLQGYEWPQNLQITIETVKSKRPTNAGVQPIAEPAESSSDSVTRVRVSNSGDARREQFEIGWVGADAKGPVSSLKIYVPPGQSRVIKAPTLPKGITAETLALTGDDADFDNRAYVVSQKADELKLLYLGNESDKDPTAPLYYLKRAFQETRRLVVQVLARPAAMPVSAADVEQTRLIIATDAIPEARIKTVQQYLNDGKTVLFTLRSIAGAETLRKIVGSDALPVTEATAGNYAMFGQIDFEHPLFAAFADPRFSDFTKIHFWKHRVVQTEKLSKTRVLARFDNGDPALIEIPQGKGTLLLLTSGWQPGDSQLALSSKFVPLLYAMLELSGSLKFRASQHYVGDELDLSAAAGAQKLVVRKPDGTEVTVVPGSKFGQTDQPGVYAVSAAEPLMRFAVNISPAESKTVPLEAEDLERLGLPLEKQSKQSAKEAEKKRQHLQAVELESRQKLWRWLIIAALVVLMVETWLAGRLTRQGPAQPGATA